MVSELRSVANALEVISGVRILRTRWYAEKINAPLPAIIIDYWRADDPLLLETGRDISFGDFFYLELAVKPDFLSDPLEALERLEALTEQTETALETAFPTSKVLLLQAETIIMPFGKQTSLSLIADLYIG